VWDFENGEYLALQKSHSTAEGIFDEAAALEHSWDDPEPERPSSRQEIEAMPPGPERADAEAKARAWTAWDRRRKRHHASVEELQNFGLDSSNSGRCRAMLTTAAPYLTRRVDEWDANPWRLTVANGSLHLDGRVALYPHSRRDLSTRIAAVEFDDSADCPKWRRFVSEVFQDKPEVAVFVQKWLGYSLTGDMSEQAFCVWEGRGANGKSTMLDVVSRLLGDYASTAQIETFLHTDRKQGAAPSPDVARLAGARLIRSSEPDPGSRLSESVLKQWTGGETVAARHLHQEFFEFRPHGKIIISCNVRPVIVGKDHGIRRRLHVVKFSRVFTEAERRERLAECGGLSLVEDLLSEGPGILNWLLDGYRLWRERGLEPPAEVVENTADYFREMDPIGQFARDCLQTAADGVGEAERERSKDLFDAYKRWCEAVNEDPKSQTAFGRRMQDLGLRSVKIGGVGYRAGVRLRQEWKQSLAGIDGTG
jgi:putative DNA primase/helicase